MFTLTSFYSSICMVPSVSRCVEVMVFPVSRPCSLCVLCGEVMISSLCVSLSLRIVCRSYDFLYLGLSLLLSLCVLCLKSIMLLARVAAAGIMRASSKMRQK